MTTLMKFPNALRAMRTLRALDACALPKTLGKNREAAIWLEVFKDAFSTRGRHVSFQHNSRRM